jgi:hypothetical protein
VGETQTTVGGGWRLQNPPDNGIQPAFTWESGATFRARWNGRLSNPVTLRLPAQMWVKKVGRRAWKVHVFAGRLGSVAFAGKTIQLQRADGSGWATIQRSQLVHRPTFNLGAGNYEAVFRTRKRWVRLRAFLPAASAAPCHLATASLPWRT